TISELNRRPRRLQQGKSVHFDFELAVPLQTAMLTNWSNGCSRMRAVIQRVSEASVTIAGQVHGAIQRGLLVLLAVEEADTADDIEWLSGKIARLRIFNDAEGVMNLSMREAPGDILLVSQFTLFASTKK